MFVTTWAPFVVATISLLHVRTRDVEGNYQYCGHENMIKECEHWISYMSTFFHIKDVSSLEEC